MQPHKKAAVFALCGLLWCSGADARTLYVCQGNEGSAPYDTPETAAGTIQQAVDAAEYRDVVKVGPGLYVEQVILHDGVVLWGAGPDVTVIERPEGAQQLEIGEPAPAVAGAADAEIRGIHILSPQYHEFEFWRGTGVYLGPWPGQLVSDCRITGPFNYGVVCKSMMQAEETVVRRCTIEGTNTAIIVRGIWANCLIQDCVMRNNKGFGVSGGRSGFGTIRVIRTTITGSTSGIYMLHPWHVSVENCTVDNNTAQGIFAEEFAVVNVWSSVVSRNSSGILCCDDSTVEVLNCTIAENRDGVVQSSALYVRIVNSILWGGEKPIVLESGDAPDISFSDVQNGFELTAETNGKVYFVDPSEGNIDADPLFVNACAGDFRLRPSSPCIDAGTPPGWDDPYRPGWWYAVDRAGRDREVQGETEFRVDMGAYEYYINRLDPGPRAHEATLTWSSKSNRAYSIFYSDDLLTWHLVLDTFPSAGNMTTSWTDDGSFTGLPPLLAPRRFYRLLENP